MSEKIAGPRNESTAISVELTASAIAAPRRHPNAKERVADELAEVRTESRQMRQGRTNFHE